MREQPPIYEATYHRGDVKYLVDQAKTKLISPCMARFGLSYREPERADSPEDNAMLRPFGVESTAERAPAVPAEPEVPVAGGKAYGLALYGPPNRLVQARGEKITVTAPAVGCEADAERRLLGDKRVRQMELRILLFEAEERSLEAFDADRSFAPVRSAWRDCMRDAGFGKAADPATLHSELPASTNLATDPSVAADLACKARLDYLPRAYATMAAIQQRELARTPGALDEYNAIQQAQVTEARDVLGS
ncbi:hypothetical protein AB0G04_33190 [Actinoplanes sp. NPDC023801]|uniref:hypothetical protein n=1 Tax=Actinoplanes sp. NPDC023801 TaxID=3154595 RepID=UPI0033F1E01A